jgi:electron transfer flavoprotein alpha subunit
MAAKDVLVYVEIRDGRAKKPALEALGAGRRLARALGGAVAVVVLGKGSRAAAAALAGASRALAGEHEVFDAFHLGAVTDAVAGCARSLNAAAVLMAATPAGREVAAAVAADLATSVASDVLEIAVREGRIEARRPVYAGKAVLTVAFRKSPAVLTTRPNVFAEEPGGAPPAEVVDLPPPAAAGARVVETVAPDVAAKSQRSRPADLQEADIIVSGGRGLRGPENFHLVEELAAALGAAVGASRAVCDAGWRPHSEQVGQTGKTVSPRLYIACGISGAIQHLAGMSSSRCIVAINKDPNAPIFQVADYGIAGDLFEVLPALTAEVKKRA